MRCAVGITACECLSNSDDLVVAFSTVSLYLPTLTELVKTSSVYRQEAARLATQCLFLKTILSLHLEGIQQAMQYAQQAVEYSEASGEIPLRITALGRLAYVYSCGKQQTNALEKALYARSLLKQTKHSFPPDVQSYVYGVVAKYQAFNNQKAEASSSLGYAHETFFAKSNDGTDSTYAYMDHDLANFWLDDGMTHLFMA